MADSALISAVASAVSAVAALAALAVALLALSAGRASARAAMKSAETAATALSLATQIRWKLDRVGRDRFLLTNVGGRTAYGVAITAPNMPLDDERTDIAPDEAVAFLAAMTYDDTEEDVVVTWHELPDCSDPEQRWKHALPE